MKNVVRKCDNILHPIGFEKKGQHWNRKNNCFVDVVSIQKSRYDESYVIEMGIYVDRARVLLGLPPLSDGFARTSNCLARAYVDAPEIKYQQWWKLADPEEVDESVIALASIGIPFLEELHDFDSLALYLLSKISKRDPKQFQWPETMYIAILKGASGHVQEALDYLEFFEVQLKDHELANQKIKNLLATLRQTKAKGLPLSLD